MLFRNILATLALPPALNLVLVLLGFLLQRRFRVLGRVLMLLGVLTLVLLALPWGKARLYTPLEVYPVVNLEAAAQLDPAKTAVVVLGGGTIGYAEEFQTVALTANSLQRIYYTRHLLESLHLPVLLSGGKPFEESVSEARQMGIALNQMGVEPRWLEQESRTTWENAVYSAAILKEQGIDTVVLVTEAWHMWRAVESFHAQGLNVLPAPTGFRRGTFADVRQYLPESHALDQSRDALHEWLGILTYRFSYGTAAAPALQAQGVIPAQRQ